MDQPNAEPSGEPDPPPAPPTFGDVVERSLAVLQRRGRVSHTALRLEFTLDDETFAALRDELVDVLGAADDDGRILIARSGAAAPAEQPSADEPAVPAEPAAPTTPDRAPAPEQAQAPPQEERRQPRALITVLLCDLDQTPELQALAADARAALTARVHAIFGEVAARRHGHVQPWVSDGVAILFGHPRQQDDDALRAVRCGWEILRTLAAAQHSIEGEFGHRVSARLGIASGAAGDGADGASPFGDAPRTAGRVQNAGGAGRLAVDAPTYARACEHFAFEPLTTDGLYAVSSCLDSPSEVRSAAIPLVGRSGERALLQALAESAADGTRSAVLVRGDAGIGKTRLLDALCESASDGLGMTLLRCAASQYHRGCALHPLLTGLRRHWQLDGDSAPARLAERARSLPGGERAVALLAQLLGVELPAGIAAPAQMSPRRRRRESLAVVADVLVAEARRAPLLLVVEDLHWADPTTVELLATLLEGPREVALMLALSARTEFVAPTSPALQRITLDRLDAEECRRIVEHVAAEAGGLPDGLDRKLAERAAGSPLFAEQLTHTVLATRDSPIGLATTLYGCLMARLDRDSTARRVAQVAATIGREFDVALVQAAGDLERSAVEWGLERLVDEDVVVAAGPDSYAFRHALLQDAARSSLSKESLRDHNLRIARALIASFPAVAAAEPERVARHLEYAGALPEAIVHWRRAGLQALAQHALREATTHFERGLELTARTPDGDERRSTELSLRVLAGLSIATRLNWSAPAVAAHYARAEQLAAALPTSTTLLRSMLGLTRYHLIGGRFEEAFALARKQATAAQKARDAEAALEAECEAAGALVLLGRHRDALPRLARVVELYDAERHGAHAQRFGRNPAAIAFAHRGIVFACRGDRAGARDAIAEAAGILRAQRHPYSHAWVQCAAATAALICDEREVVLREAAVAIQIAGDEGFGDWLGYASVLHGWARVQNAEHEDGLEECVRGAAEWDVTAAVALRPFLQGLLGDAYARAGQFGPGLEALDEALALGTRGERWCEPELHRMRAGLLLAAGDRTGALRSAQTALALAKRSGAAGWERRAVATLERVSGAQRAA